MPPNAEHRPMSQLPIARYIAREVAKTAGATWLRAHATEGNPQGTVITLELARNGYSQALSLSDLEHPQRTVLRVLAHALKGKQLRPTSEIHYN